MVRITESLAGSRVFQAGEGDDVARERLFDVLSTVRMHQKHAADTLRLVLDGIENAGTGIHRTRIDAHEGDRTHERIVQDFEGQPREWGFVVCRTFFFFVGVRYDTLQRRDVPRRW